MKFKFNIQNLGNIKNANIDIKPFTLIAGKNSSGKSFVTKSLYSILDALNNNYIENEILVNIHKIKRNFAIFENAFVSIAKIDQEFIEMFYEDTIPILEITFNDIKEDKNENNIKNLKYLLDESEIYFKKRSSLVKFNNKVKYLKNHIKYLENILNVINNPDEIIVNGISQNLNDNFKKNYQITEFEAIVNTKTKSKTIQISMDNIGNMTIDKKNLLDFEFTTNGINEIQELSNVVYLDSPIYIKIRKGLEKNAFHNPFFTKGNRYLNEYPLYVENLYGFIDKKYIDEADFKSISDDISKLIDGSLKLNKSGSLEYIQEDGAVIPLSLTAMGIANLGIIDLLIANNIINKGSFLIIDEPEVNLHPDWQVALTKFLYKISKAGANVIIATHSIDIVKTVELLIEADENDCIAINKMPFEESFVKKSQDDKIKDVLTDFKHTVL